ncbi:MAG: ABC transporter substrate-binding protein [Proteobacteria bacterium]|nr:ABC transporter substrate-binding protein [Pseudomonadota bacterium]
MDRRAFLGGLLLGPWAGTAHAADPLPALRETPLFAGRVAAGTLPPVDRRVPQRPLVVDRFAGADGPGRPGGQLTMLVTATRDNVLMTIYSYARLIVYDPALALVPDILEGWETTDGRDFTFRLRPGHRWSDGQSFTTEDFRFWWEDVANDPELSPFGPPDELLVDGRPPRVAILDELTVRYSWDAPNPYFVESQARANPLFLFVPAHYFRRFHPRHGGAPPAEEAARGWVQPFRRRLDAMFANDVADLPSLNPWVLTTPPPAQRYVFERNPYYHRVDRRGQQLPYVDRFVFALTTPNLIAARAGLGESDLQARWLKLRDYTFLQNGAKTARFGVRLWEFGSGSQLALYPNFNAADPAWRRVLRDVRFRRALSMAIDRGELNEVVWLGLGKPSNNTVLPRSPLFRPDYATRWAGHDPRAAAALLDEMGLDGRDIDGIRRLPDGRPLVIVVESQSEQTEEADALKLIGEHWRRVGVGLLVKQQTFETFWLRVTSGEAVMTAYGGLFNAVPGAASSPREYAPTMQGGLQWPKWGLYVASRGKLGEPCDVPEARGLLDDVQAWERAADDATRQQAWHRILETSAAQVFTIGTVNAVPQPIVVGGRLRNVPRDGLFAWDPGSYFGVYRPDTFWLES